MGPPHAHNRVGGALALALVALLSVTTGHLLPAAAKRFRDTDVAAAVANQALPQWMPGPVLTYPDQATGTAFGQVLALADVDGDGTTDILVGAPGASVEGHDRAGAVVVFLGPDFGRDRSLTDPAPTANARLGSALAVADLDADGRPEIIAGAPGGRPPGAMGVVPEPEGKVLIFRGPAFESVRTVPAATGPGAPGFGGSLAVGDVTGDGALDLIVGDTEPWVDPLDRGRDRPARPQEGVRVLVGPALEDGPLLRTASESVFGPCSIWDCSYFGAAVAVGDINGDGRADLLVGEPFSIDVNAARGTVYVFLAPELTPGPRLRGMLPGQFTNLFGGALAVADLDGDGAADLVAGEPSTARTIAGPSPGPSGEVSVFTSFMASDGPARRRVGPVTAERDPRFGSSVAVADVDGDGHADILIGAHEPGDHIAILLGPAFATNQTLDGVTGTAMAVGDLNKDGRADIVALAPDEQVQVFFSMPGSP